MTKDYINDRSRNHASAVFNLLNHVNSDSRITPAARCVFYWLCWHLNGRIDFTSSTCWPSNNRLAQLSTLNKETVSHAIKNLEKNGYIEVGREPRKNNVYTVMDQEKWQDATIRIRKNRTGLVGKTVSTYTEIPDVTSLSLTSEREPITIEADGAEIQTPKKAREESKQEAAREDEGTRPGPLGDASGEAKPQPPLPSGSPLSFFPPVRRAGVRPKSSPIVAVKPAITRVQPTPEAIAMREQVARERQAKAFLDEWHARRKAGEALQ